MMPRYIDADSAINDLCGSQCGCTINECGLEEPCEKARCILRQPTADVQEVRHGHWIDKGVLENYPRPDINVYHLLWCSECGALHRVRPYCEGGWINANYCPNCGAKMDLKEGE